MASAQAALAAYLAKTYPNLSTNDIIKLVASGLTAGQIDRHLSHLCGGLSGIAQLIIDSYGGDAHAQNLLNRLTQLGDSGKKGDVGAQRIMGVLNKLGVDNVWNLEVPVPDPVNPSTPPGQLPKADIVLKDGTAIEVGGPRKAESRGRKFKKEIQALIRGYGVDNTKVYLENNGGSASQRAKDYAISELASAPGGDRALVTNQIHTFFPSDRLCV